MVAAVQPAELIFLPTAITSFELLIVLLFALGRRAAGFRAGLLAAALYAFSPCLT